MKLRIGAILLLLMTGYFAKAQIQSPWQQHDGAGTFALDSAVGIEGAVWIFDDAVIPPAADPAWMPAPDPDTIGFNDSSEIPPLMELCFMTVDYRYFQSFLDLTSSPGLIEASLLSRGMDDGIRISIFNSDHPSGTILPDGYGFYGDTLSLDLLPYLKPGEVNRLVITQVDDCPVITALEFAELTLVTGDPAAIPTVGAWGLIIFGMVIICIGQVVLFNAHNRTNKAHS